MKRLYIFLIVIFTLSGANAQITTSGINGMVTDKAGQPLIGATVIAIHTPSGSQFGAVTNTTGRYSIQGMRAGGPYTVIVSFVGYLSHEFTDITLILGETMTRSTKLEDTNELEAIVVTADGKSSPMNINRAGAITSISKEQIQMMPTTSRSINDIMKLSPQATSTTSGLALGGGNYRQSYVTVDGAAFNNAFGIGSNLPSAGSPISLDALEQISIAITPFDVRQSGFIGGAINAVTKSGTNQLKVSVYNLYKSDKLQGTRIADGAELNKLEMFNNTLGFNIGTPIIKDKLFLFTNFEYEWNTNPGQRQKARNNETEEWGQSMNRPTVGKMEEIKSFLKDKLGYDPGRYQDYSTNTPGWKFMARMDWNINRNHSMNVRFSTTRTKYSAPPSTSISPLSGYDRDNNGRLSTCGLYFENSRYYQQLNFTSVAAELNSHFADGAINNILRATYSHQHEPRSFDGELFPTVDILEPLNDENKTNALYTTFGVDPYTYGSIRDVSTYVVTDEISYSTGIHNLIGGVQFEHNNTMNGYMQGGAGYYIFNTWDSFIKAVDPTTPGLENVDGTPLAFAITHANRSDLKQTFASLNIMQFSGYFQNEMNLSNRLKATLGIRFEVPTYPSLKNNENVEFTKLFAANGGYKTSDMPKAKINVSPRFGFNWDMTGERKYIMRGGTGVFTGRMPLVWIISALGNSNCNQAQKILYAKDGEDKMPGFHTNISDILNDPAIYGGKFEQKALPAPQSATIIDKNLKMPSTWKTSLTFDLKLPAGIDLNMEGIFNQDINAVAVTKLGQIEKVGGIKLPGEPRARKSWISQGIKNSEGSSVNPYLIGNSDIAGYYFSLTGQAQKRFRNGISLMAAYTYSQSKNVIDGLGDQVTSVYNTNTFGVDGSNTPELGYSSFVTPHRILASIAYRKEYGNNFGTSIALFYEGARQGYIGIYSYTRYSYTCFTQGRYLDPVVGDGGAQNLIYVPTDEQLTEMPFTDDANRNKYQNFINGDKYLSSIKGEYSQRGGAVMPWFHSVNFKFAQDFYVNVRGKRNTITVGIDINNVANLLNRNWGDIKQLSTNSILSYSKDKAGEMKYTFIEPKWQSYSSLISTWSALFSVRYTFN